MLLYCNDGPAGAGLSSGILLFGLGLIGRQIGLELDKTPSRDRIDIPIRWDDMADVRGRLLEIGALCRRHRLQSLEVIWSAGISGFSTGSSETLREMESFVSILSGLTALEIRMNVHFFSSAGGLHEGMVMADDERGIVISRPYSILKREMEEFLKGQQKDGRIGRLAIYRPSSVFGYLRPGIRAGLIGTLIKNGIVNQTTDIAGNLSTFRDYVFSADIAGFVAGKIRSSGESEVSAGKPEVYYLCSGKPSSIFEIIRIINRILRKRVLIRMVETTNALDTSFSPSLLPAGWSPTPLPVAVQQIYSAHLTNGS